MKSDEYGKIDMEGIGVAREEKPLNEEGSENCPEIFVVAGLAE